MKKKVKLAWVSTHPIQYQAPLFKEITNHSSVDLTVIFASDFSIKPYEDKEFQKKILWDSDLLEGYKYDFLCTIQKKINAITFFKPFVYGLLTKLKRGNFDFVMIQGWNHYVYIIAILYAKLLGIKVGLRCEASSHIKPRKGIRGFVRKIFLWVMFQFVDKFFAIGTSNQLFYLKMGVHTSQLELMPYSVDNHFFSTKAAAADIKKIKEALGFNRDAPIVMYASKLTERKRPNFLLRAFLDCNFSGMVKPYMAFIGTGEIKNQLISMAHDHQDSVKFFDFINQNELPNFYAIADIFVLPSLDETWGLVINEAMNAGVAIIVSDQVGSGFDLVEHGKNGLIFQANNIDELKSCITYLVHESNYKEYGAASKSRINAWGFKQAIEGLEGGISSALMKF